MGIGETETEHGHRYNRGVAGTMGESTDTDTTVAGTVGESTDTDTTVARSAGTVGETEDEHRYNSCIVQHI